MFHCLTFICHCFSLHVLAYMTIFRFVQCFYFQIPEGICFAGFTCTSLRFARFHLRSGINMGYYYLLLFMLFLYCYIIYVFYFLTSPISQPSLDISHIWILHICDEVTNSKNLLWHNRFFIGLVCFKSWMLGFHSTGDISCRHLIGFIYSPFIFIH
jgi:hypothetical protein